MGPGIRRVERGYIDWIDLTQDREKRRAVAVRSHVVIYTFFLFTI
jgi:hypothetical protein